MLTVALSDFTLYSVFTAGAPEGGGAKQLKHTIMDTSSGSGQLITAADWFTLVWNESRTDGRLCILNGQTERGYAAAAHNKRRSGGESTLAD